jgi:uncharacterized protein (DUF2062 family)
MAADSGGDFLIPMEVGFVIATVMVVVYVAALVVLIVWLVRRSRHTEN